MNFYLLMAITGWPNSGSFVSRRCCRLPVCWPPRPRCNCGCRHH